MLKPKYVEEFLLTHNNILSQLYFEKYYTKDYLLKSSLKELDSFFDIITYVGKNEISINNITIINPDDIAISIIFNCSNEIIDNICDFLVEENICYPDGSNIKTSSKNYDFYKENFLNFRFGKYDKNSNKFTDIFFKTCSYNKVRTFSNIISKKLEIDRKNIVFTISTEDDFGEFKKLIFRCKGIYKSSNFIFFTANPIFKKVR